MANVNYQPGKFMHVSFQSSTLIGRAVTRSQTSLGVRARFRLGFRAGYDVFRMYAVLISTNQIRALKITPMANSIATKSLASCGMFTPGVSRV